jgi:hypothetical protein
MFIVALAIMGTTITWAWAPFWTPWGFATGVYLAATVDSKQRLPFFLQHSVTGALLNGIGLIFNVVAGYFYIRLWFACIVGWGKLDTLEQIMCSDEEWLVWVTAIAAGLIVLVSLGQTLTAAYDAFVRITGTRAFSAAQRGFEGASDVFGQRFSKAFGQARRLGGRGRGRGEEEEDLLDEGEGEGAEDMYAGSRIRRKQQRTQKARGRPARSRQR